MGLTRHPHNRFFKKIDKGQIVDCVEDDMVHAEMRHASGWENATEEEYLAFSAAKAESQKKAKKAN